MTKQEKSKEPLSPTAKKKLEVLKKQKQDQKIKQYLTADFAYTGIPGAKATAAGVFIKKQKQNPNKLKLNSPSGGVGAGMRRFNRGGKV